MIQNEYVLNNTKTYYERYETLFHTVTRWVEQMMNLVQCWNLLDGRIVELTTLVKSQSEDQSEGISIEKLETQLSDLKDNFKEKEEMLKKIESYCGPHTLYPVVNEIMTNDGKVQDEVQEVGVEEEVQESKEETKAHD